MVGNLFVGEEADGVASVRCQVGPWWGIVLVGEMWMGSRWGGVSTVGSASYDGSGSALLRSDFVKGEEDTTSVGSGLISSLSRWTCRVWFCRDRWRR